MDELINTKALNSNSLNQGFEILSGSSNLLRYMLEMKIVIYCLETKSSVVAVLDLVSIQSKDKEQDTSIPRPSLLKVKQYDFLRIQQG